MYFSGQSPTLMLNTQKVSPHVALTASPHDLNVLDKQKLTCHSCWLSPQLSLLHLFHPDCFFLGVLSTLSPALLLTRPLKPSYSLIFCCENTKTCSLITICWILFRNHLIC